MDMDTKKTILSIISMLFFATTTFFLGYEWKSTNTPRVEKAVVEELKFDGVSNSATGQEVRLIQAKDLKEWLLERQDREIISISIFQDRPGEIRALVVSRYKGRLVIKD